MQASPRDKTCSHLFSETIKTWPRATDNFSLRHPHRKALRDQKLLLLLTRAHTDPGVEFFFSIENTESITESREICRTKFARGKKTFAQRRENLGSERERNFYSAHSLRRDQKRATRVFGKIFGRAGRDFFSFFFVLNVRLTEALLSILCKNLPIVLPKRKVSLCGRAGFLQNHRESRAARFNAVCIQRIVAYRQTYVISVSRARLQTIFVNLCAYIRILMRTIFAAYTCTLLRYLRANA